MEWCIGPRPQVHLENPPVKRPCKKRKKIGCPLEIPEIPYWKHQHFQEVLSKTNWRWILWSQRFFEQEWALSAWHKQTTDISKKEPDGDFSATATYHRFVSAETAASRNLEVQSPSTAVQKLGWHGPAEWWVFALPQENLPNTLWKWFRCEDSAQCAGVSWALNLLYTQSLQTYFGWTLHEILSIKSLVGRSLQLAAPNLFPSGLFSFSQLHALKRYTAICRDGKYE